MLEEKIKQIISDQLGLPLKEVEGSSLMVRDLGMDSLDTLEVAIFVEEAFDIELADDALEGLTDIDSLCALVQSKVKDL